MHLPVLLIKGGKLHQFDPLFTPLKSNEKYQTYYYIFDQNLLSINTCFLSYTFAFSFPTIWSNKDARLSGHELLETDGIDEKTGQPKYKRKKEEYTYFLFYI